MKIYRPSLYYFFWSLPALPVAGGVLFYLFGPADALWQSYALFLGAVSIFYYLSVFRLRRVEFDGKSLRIRPGLFSFSPPFLLRDIDVGSIYRIDRLIQGDLSRNMIPLLHFYVRKAGAPGTRDDFNFWINPIDFMIPRAQVRDLLRSILEVNPEIKLADGLDLFLRE